MRVQSQILAALLHHAGVLAEPENVNTVEVPTVCLPTIKVPVAASPLVAGVAGAQAASFTSSRSDGVANAAASQQVVAILRPGLWELVIQAVHVSVFTSTHSASIQIRYGQDQNIQNLLTLGAPSGNFTISESVTVTLSLERNSDIIVFVESNGVGEVSLFQWILHANRLL